MYEISGSIRIPIDHDSSLPLNAAPVTSPAPTQTRHGRVRRALGRQDQYRGAPSESGTNTNNNIGIDEANRT